jgi:hypothetical protein
MPERDASTQFLPASPRLASPDQAIPALDSAPLAPRIWAFYHTPPMGQQTNKHIKKKRRIAYLKRKKEAAKKTTASKKSAKAKK